MLLLALLFLLRGPLLRGMGNFLITEDRLEHADVVYVLGGNSLDRGREAARLYSKGFAPSVVCTGANKPSLLKALGIDMSEAEVTRTLSLRMGVSAGDVELLQKGTSTREEAQAVVAHCQERGFEKAIVLSSKFHLRRVNMVFRPLFEDAGIQLILVGAPSSSYVEAEWWRSEEGLIMVNNEYVKLLYYWWAY